MLVTTQRQGRNIRNLILDLHRQENEAEPESGCLHRFANAMISLGWSIIEA